MYNSLLEHIIQELNFNGIMRKSRSITKLFPTFRKRVRDVAKAGGVTLVNTFPEYWQFSVSSSNKENNNVDYDVFIRFKNLEEVLKKYAADRRLWNKAGDFVDYRQLAMEVMNKVDLEQDCSCLTGDTLIPLLDGRTLSLEELHAEFGSTMPFWIYASDEQGDFVPAQAISLGVRREVTELIEVTLDNNKVIKCTPDHLFRLRDGSYIEANKLVAGASLMPLYLEVREPNRKYSCAYRYFKINSKKDSKGRTYWKSVHRAVAEFVLQEELRKKNNDLISTGIEKFLVVHHKAILNSNGSLNNDPTNLEWLGKLEHWKRHALFDKENVILASRKYHADPKNKEKIHADRSKAGKACHAKHPELYANFNKVGVAFMQSAEGRVNATRTNKERWSVPENHQKASQAAKESKTLESNLSVSNAKKKWWNDHPEARSEMANRRLNRDIVKTKQDGNDGHPINARIGKIFKKLYDLEKCGLEVSKENFLKFNALFNLYTAFPSFDKAVYFYRLCRGKRVHYKISDETVSFVKGYLERMFEIRKCLCCGADFSTQWFSTQKLCGKKCRGRWRGLHSRKQSLIDSLHNHKVIGIRNLKLTTPVKVYDLSVDKYQNFALDAGIFVHNCPADLYWGSEYIKTQRSAQFGHEEDRSPDIRNPHQYGALCKHGELVFEVLPMYVGTFAGFLKKFWNETITDIVDATQKEVVGMQAATAELGRREEERPVAYGRGGKEIPIATAPGVPEENPEEMQPPEEEEIETPKAGGSATKPTSVGPKIATKPGTKPTNGGTKPGTRKGTK